MQCQSSTSRGVGRKAAPERTPIAFPGTGLDAMTSVRSRRLAGGGLLLTAISIPVQIAGGVNYPTVPPGLIILLVAAAIMLLAPWRWAGFVALVATLFLCFGAIAAPNFRHQPTEPGQTLAFAGSLVQVAGLVLAVAGLPPALRHWTVRPEA